MSAKHSALHASFRPCRDYLFCLALLVAVSCFMYGMRPLLLVLLALATALVCDLIAGGMRRRAFDITDLSSYMFAAIFTVMLPASARYEMVIVGAAVTVLLGKHAFGGYGNYPFHPAAFGFAVATVCWPDSIFKYPATLSSLGLGASGGGTLHEGVAYTLKHGGIPDFDAMDLILGNYPGPVGTTSCVIIIALLVLLVAHGSVTWHIPVTYLAICAVWALLFPRIQAPLHMSLMYEMFSGAVIFSAVFIVAEPTLAPVHPRAKVVYGALLGICAMFFRYFGVYEMGNCFAVLLINPLSASLDRMFLRHTKSRRLRT